MGSNTGKSEAVLAVSTAVAIAVIGGLIAVIPELNRPWEYPVVIALSLCILVPAVVITVRESRRLVARKEFGDEVTGYRFDENTGILIKGEIQNVSLRVETIHRILDSLVGRIPTENKEEALAASGFEAGELWAKDFKKTAWTSGIDGDDIGYIMNLWGVYDATAGMGRLSIAMSADWSHGHAMIINPFLSRLEADFPLNYWFSGYIAGTLGVLLGGRYSVELRDPSANSRVHISFLISKQ